jgi:hypothetical protein
MTDIAELRWRSGLIGAGGAASMDAWSWLLRRRFGIRGLDYAMLGRWIGHFRHRRFFHERIAAADPIRWERTLGWLAHYAIGIAFAVLLLAIWGLDWARSPTVVPPLLIGLGTIAAPWLVMQPGMGAGIAASRTPDPRTARLRNLGTHTVYGLGVFATATTVTLFWR